jgi:hypothetical protein
LLLSLFGLPAFCIVQMMLLQRLEDNIGPFIAPAPRRKPDAINTPHGDQP